MRIHKKNLSRPVARAAIGRRRLPLALSPLAVAAAMAVSAPAWANNDDPSAALQLRTSFASPGAKAAGMGGAFIGLSDDSSAAFLNPAGLRRLPNTEMTVELRYRDGDPRFLPGIVDGTASASSPSTLGISYLSLAIPSVGDWGFGFFYGELTNGSIRADAQGDIDGNFYRFPGSNERFTSFSAAAKVTDRYIGGSVAYEFRPNFRVGAALYSIRRDFSSESNFLGGFQVSAVGRDEDIGLNLGLHWLATDKLSVGLAWRSPLEFSARSECNFSGVCRDVLADGSLPEANQKAASTALPSSLTLGFGYQVSPDFVLALDISQVKHAQRVSRATPGLSFNVYCDQLASDCSILAGLQSRDGTDVRFGAEYALGTKHPVFVRAGVWRESDPSIYYRSSGPTVNDIVVLVGDNSFQKAGATTHVTAGLGLQMNKWAVDFAIDKSSRQTEATASFVWYFN